MFNKIKNITQNKQALPLHDDERLNTLKEIAEDEAKAILRHVNDFNWEVMIDIFLKFPSLHEKFIKKIYPQYRYFSDVEALSSAGYNSTYFTTLESKTRLYLREKHMIVAPSLEKKHTILALYQPTINIPDIEFDEIVFMGTALYNNYFQTQFEIEGEIKHSFKDLLQYIENKKINDLHITAIDENQYTITGRIGAVVTKLTKSLRHKEDIEALLHEAKLMMDKETTEDPPETTGLLKTVLVDDKGRPINRTFRMNVIQAAKGLELTTSVSIRRLMNLNEISRLGLKGLNYTQELIDLIEKIKQKPFGINIISGKTNSGKSTLLTTILYELYQQSKRIIAIENPVEIEMPYDQIDLSITEGADDKFKMTRQRAAKSLLRHDPDIVLISEIRDEEIADLIEMGAKGSIAYSTIHAGDVKSTLLRLIHKAANPEDVIATINGIIAQSLVSKICDKCGGSGKIGENDCGKCNGLGKSGVVPILEIAYFKNLQTKDVIKMDGNVDYNKLFDFEELQREGKIEYISKKQIAKEFFDKKMIAKEDYEKFLL